MSQDATDSSSLGSNRDKRRNSKLYDDPETPRNNLSTQMTRTISDFQERAKSSTSILKSKNSMSLKSRRDSYGVLIRYQTKKHRIQFKEDISEVKEVENWKDYNLEARPCCQCNLM